jgi:hypothetical protein
MYTEVPGQDLGHACWSYLTKGSREVCRSFFSPEPKNLLFPSESHLRFISFVASGVRTYHIVVRIGCPYRLLLRRDMCEHGNACKSYAKGTSAEEFLSFRVYD